MGQFPLWERKYTWNKELRMEGYIYTCIKHEYAFLT